jgi:hypothetical protein
MLGVHKIPFLEFSPVYESVKAGIGDPAFSYYLSGAIDPACLGAGGE